MGGGSMGRAVSSGDPLFTNESNTQIMGETRTLGAFIKNDNSLQTRPQRHVDVGRFTLDELQETFGVRDSDKGNNSSRW
jgi:hypothetical protein